MDNCEKFNETLLEKEDFYSQLKYGRYYWCRLRTHMGEYHDLYVQSDTLLLPDVFENFRNMCLNMYNVILENFFQLID